MTKILLADDHKLMRKGLRTILEKEEDFEVVGEAQSGREAIEFTRQLSPQVVVMDVAMFEMNGISATKQIVAEFPQIKILGLSMHPSGNIAGEMIKAGASGYMTKNSAVDELVMAIRQILADKTFLSPEISRSYVDSYLSQGTIGPKSQKLGSALSSREKEVLQLVAEGKPSKAIADELFITEKTVGAHRQNIMDKLGLRSIAELTKYAIQEGLTPLD